MRCKIVFIFCFLAQFCFAQTPYPVSTYTLDSAFIPGIHDNISWGRNYNYSQFYVYKPSNYNPSVSPILFGCYATGSNGIDVAGALQAMADARGALIVAAHFATRINEPTKPVSDSLYLNYPIGGLSILHPATLIYKHIYRRVLQREGRDSIPCYMIGFSAGGQFVSRYMLYRQSYPDSIPLKMAVSCNPYFYTFPTKEHLGLPMYYLEGLDMGSGRFNYPGFSAIDSLEQKVYNYIGFKEHIKQYYQENYAVLIGTADNGSLGDYGPINTQQGTNRYNRAKSFYNFALADAANYGVALNWQYKEIPGIGHDQGGMFYTKQNASDTYSIAEHILFDSPYTKVKQIAPVADFIVSANVVTLPTAIVSFTNKSQLATSYFWSFGDGQYSSAINPTHLYSHTGKYIVQLVAKNNTGCENWIAKMYVIQVTGTNPIVTVPPVIVPEPEISLDTTFGIMGASVIQIGSPQDYAHSAVIQNDGKIVVAGTKTNGSAGWDFAVSRFNDNGSLDNSFNGNGIVVTDIGSRDDKGNAVAMQKDGKILVGGTMGDGTDLDYALVRYNSDGSIDNSFGGDGIITTDFGNLKYDFGCDIALQNDNKIILAGHSFNGTFYEFSMARYNADGSLDISFDGDGLVTTSIGTKHDYAYSIVLQADGKIILVGRCNNGLSDDFAIVRYNTNGSLDLTFNTTGKVITQISDNKDVANSVVIQSDGKIVVAGSANNGLNNDFVLARYNSNGFLDPSFGTATDGIVRTSINNGDDLACDLAIDMNNKIWAGGYSYNGSNNDFALACYLSNGELDVTFDRDGKITTGLGRGHNYGKSIAVQGDGKIILAGYAWRDPYSYDFTMFRYNICTSLNNSVTQNETLLHANSEIATYQWLDCTNSTYITNETNQDFTAQTNGSYAVIVNENNCVSASECFQITEVGMEKNKNTNQSLQLIPNPSNNSVLVLFNSLSVTNLSVTNIAGQTIYETKISNENNYELETKNWSNGMYFVNVLSNSQKLTLNLLVQH